MKKLSSTICLLAFVSLMFADGIQPAGSGIETDPYQIATLDNLLWLSTNTASWDKHFIQTSDIDASDTENWNSSEGFTPIGNNTDRFSGSYDGNYNTILNLYIDRPDSEKQAMFGMIQGAVIQNLLLENVSITARRHIGGLIGFAGWSASIEHCHSSGSVNTTYDWAGGLIGYASSGTVISQSSSSCDVTGGSTIGGLIGGTSSYCEVYDCYATGSVSGGNTKGGFSGSDDWLYSSAIHRSYSTGLVSDGSWTGGFIGDDGVAYDCFWDMQTSGQTTSDGGTGKNTLQMQDIATFTDLTSTGLDNPWDFVNNPNDDTADDDIWTINSTLNNGYPVLTWRLLNADFKTYETEIIVGDTINFIDKSSGSISSWAWDFDGDDNIDSNEENPTWEYTAAGTYSVTLTISNGREEDSETKVNYITVYEPDISRNLIAYYPFEGNSNDLSGNEHHGTNYGATPTSDRFGNTNFAYDFDGSNDYIGLGDWFTYQDFTISLWVNQDGINDTYVDIIDNNHTGSQNWAAQYDSNSGSYYFFTQPQGATEFTLPNNEWKNLVFIKDGENLRMYMNNVLIDEIAATSSEINYNSQNLFIARWADGGRHFDGKIDDIRMYDRALAESEVNQLYQESNPVLAAPQNVSIDISETSISIYWDAVDGASAYKVYSSTNPDSGFTEDMTGTYNGNSWNTAATENRRFYQVKASN